MRPLDPAKWEQLMHISKTSAPGGAWLFEYHGEWAGSEYDAQAFRSLAWAKRYSRDEGETVRWVKHSPTHWIGYVPIEQESQ